MAGENSGFDQSVMQANVEALASNPYPGRGIVLGVSESGENAVQAYWVMGRSDNSRNRVLVEEVDGTVKTEPFDPAKVQDPSLIIYNAMRTVGQWIPTHLVSNGNQTDTMHGGLMRGPSSSIGERFITSLLQREFEPDAPNYTPRISGATYVGDQQKGRHYYSLINRNPASGLAERTFGEASFSDIPDGAGLCFHTYQGDGDPLPSFSGSPYGVPVEETAQETAEALWDLLDTENRVALVTKTINRETGEVGLHIINQLEEAA